MIIVLEGPRGVGKTTIATLLEGKLVAMGMPVIRHKWERGEFPYVDMAGQIRKDLVPGQINIVDRFHLTEYVMGRHLRRNPVKFLHNATMWIDAFLEMRHAIGLVLTASEKVLEKRMADHKPEDMPIPKALTLWRHISLHTYFEQRENNTPKDMEDIVSFLEWGTTS